MLLGEDGSRGSTIEDFKVSIPLPDQTHHSPRAQRRPQAPAIYNIPHISGNHKMRCLKSKGVRDFPAGIYNIIQRDKYIGQVRVEQKNFINQKEPSRGRQSGGNTRHP